jgi:hypothetical protein
MEDREDVRLRGHVEGDGGAFLVDGLDHERAIETRHVFGNTELAFFTAAYIGASAVGGGELDAFTDFVVGVRTSCFVSLFGLSEFGREEVILHVLEIGFEAFYDVHGKDFSRDLCHWCGGSKGGNEPRRATCMKLEGGITS